MNVTQRDADGSGPDTHTCSPWKASYQDAFFKVPGSLQSVLMFQRRSQARGSSAGGVEGWGLTRGKGIGPSMIMRVHSSIFLCLVGSVIYQGARVEGGQGGREGGSGRVSASQIESWRRAEMSSAGSLILCQGFELVLRPERLYHATASQCSMAM